MDVPLDQLINKRGTTWRGLSDVHKAEADTTGGAIALMIHKPSIIKRPVVVVNGRVKTLGFSAEQYETLFA
jgi:arsenate reductase-like glutaredoxin family protein